MNYTTKSFIEIAKEKRTDKNWDLSKVIYVNSHTKVCVGCPVHGDFWITPTNFLSGKGCKQCAIENRKHKTNEQVISEFKKIHGDAYDYSKVNYKGAKEKVCVICKKHGEFLISPDKHLSGQGCQKCSIENKSNAKYFLEKSILLHNNYYDYTKVKYINNHTKVCITCPEHGDFWIMPNSHLKGNGCQKCKAKEKELSKSVEIELKKKRTIENRKENFLKKAKQIHNNKYDYSKVNYVNSKTKVCIVCPEHGEFWQTPNAHLSGKGCKKCAGFNKTNSELINQFKKIHGDKYDYSKINYVKAKEKICIICPEHGKFWMTPNKHIQGEGCPICKESKLERETRLFLVKNNIKFVEKANKKIFGWIGMQHLDFYLPEYNIAIECQGKQHFKKSNYFFGKTNIDERFQNEIDLDIKKNNLCKKHNVTLVYLFEKRYKKNDLLNNNIFRGIYTNDNTYNDVSEIARELQLI